MNEKTLSKESGQSLVLVAGAMVILVLFVAITVDVSNAYYNRRTAQNGADGAALAGVSRMATQINNKNMLDSQIHADMNDFAERNGIADTGGDLADVLNDNVDAWYVDADGDRLSGEPMVGGGTVPEGAYGIEAITYIVAPTFFGGVFGLDGLALDARAVSILGQACGSDCVVPITTDVSLLLYENGEPRIGDCFNIFRESQTEVATPGLFGWVNWSWQEAMCSDPIYGDGRPCPGVDQGVNGCSSKLLGENLNPAHCNSGFVKVGDWLSGNAGVKNAKDVRCQLRYYLGTHDMDCNERATLEPHEFTIPVYDITNMDAPYFCNSMPCLRMKDLGDVCSGGLHYRVAGFARMQLLGYQLSQGGSKSVNDGQDGSNCVTIGDAPNGGNRITAEFREYVTDWDTGESCFDPSGTLLSAPRLNE